jgi:hypothetical protein
VSKKAWVLSILVGTFALIGTQFRCASHSGGSNPLSGMQAPPNQPETVFAGGYTISNTGSPGTNSTAPGYWVDGAWIALEALSPVYPIRYGSTVGSMVNALTIDPAGNVYAAGDNYNNAGVDVPGYWENGTWAGLTPLDPAENSSVQSLAYNGGILFAGGYSTSAGNTIPGYWAVAAAGTTWNALSLTDGTNSYPGGGVNSISLTGTAVYAAGWVGSSTAYACYWLRDGSLHVPAVENASGLPGQAYSIALGPNGIYAAGSSIINAGSVAPGYWLGAYSGTSTATWTPFSLVESNASPTAYPYGIVKAIGVPVGGGQANAAGYVQLGATFEPCYW